MSDPIGTYTFLPWLRQGVANRINAPATAQRAAIHVSVDIEGAKKGGGSETVNVARDVELYGPGDIIGIDGAQISRVEPDNWVTNFEPNYFASIEFYDEDFPWRYTPAPPVGRRLLPWLALIVLEEGTEFKEGTSVASRPLPYVEVTAPFASIFPDAAEGWAWAHAHFNAAFSDNVVEADAALAATKAQQIIASAGDTACSRILCPRKLKPKTAYHAFLVPAFESGRLAGLGKGPAPFFNDAANGLSATSSAWGDYAIAANRPEPTYFPFYHRWYFRTSDEGDFESLVRLLKPRPVDSRVGHRDLDVTDPAPNVTGIDDPALGGILRLGGALRAPIDTLGDDDRALFEIYDGWATPYPQPFQQQLATFVNLADSYQQDGAGANSAPALDDAVNDDPDPLITPPIYGQWHAMTERLLTEQDGGAVPNDANWVHDLNLDPRWRVSAGYGTKVVQQNQESYMEAAWDQIGDVLEANRRIRFAQLARHAGRRLHVRHLTAKAENNKPGFLLLQAPVSARILSDGLSVNYRIAQSPMSVALTSTAMRRTLRPAGRLAKRLNLASSAAIGTLVTRANDAAISAAPPREPLENLLTPDDLAAAAAPKQDGIIGTILDMYGAAKGRQRLLLLALLLLLLLFIIGGPSALLLGLALLAAAWFWLQPKLQQAKAAGALTEEQIKPESVDALPGSSGFTLVETTDSRTVPNVPTSRPGGIDNATAGNFKLALKDQYRLIDISREAGKPPVLVPVDIPKVTQDSLKGLDPAFTVPRWVLSGLTIPPRIREQIGETFVEAMAYPEFDIPMYEPLVKAGTDYFVPNIHLVEPDSVTLLETNQKFIEAYMVGLNHEFARELLWREYPTDQRGSYFRQFWDVRKKLAQDADKTAAREALKDIRPLHLWPQASDLGDHDNREAGQQAEEELVLVIRGELLKKYPNAIISAQPAKWHPKADGTPDKTKERELDESVTPITPLYEARVAPDIYFFGFDLTALKARGDDTVDDKPGWFFRIEEAPGDARFGFDIAREPGAQINVWNDLSWPDVAPGMADGAPLRIGGIPALTLQAPTDASVLDKDEQWQQDRHLPIDANLSSAELAYISLQTPVIMAVHASELLPDQGN